MVNTTPTQVTTYIEANKLTWNRDRAVVHDYLARANRSNQGLPVDTSWRPTALEMHRNGATTREIAAKVGRSQQTVHAWLMKQQTAA